MTRVCCKALVPSDATSFNIVVSTVSLPNEPQEGGVVTEVTVIYTSGDLGRRHLG